MVQLTRIYTKSGDKGKSSLGDGRRLKKIDKRFKAIGSIDEVNAAIGLLATELSKEILDLIKRIQNDLFDLGADLAVPQGKSLRISEAQVIYLEAQIDFYNDKLQPLNSFVLPGGTKASSLLHLVRTITRRAERDLFELNEEDSLNSNILCYINRLSDLMFVLARHCNNNGSLDVLWKPGENL